jgi:hypothetical protein
MMTAQRWVDVTLVCWGIFIGAALAWYAPAWSVPLAMIALVFLSATVERMEGKIRVIGRD